YQSLFPYRFFVSPEFVVLEKRCSICHKPVSIRNPCEHRVGEIYDGEMSCREITKLEPVAMGLVETPAQKYSVLFLVDPETSQSHDHYNYALIQYLMEGLREPLDAWDMRWTKRRHPHSRYNHVGRNEKCPCGSGKKYKHCCLRESGVLRPHCEIIFSIPPPEHLPTIQYV
ncbi:MAG: SEC-C metal-binding domain-containing protein, partial [Promethearchaeota archaeon]